MGWAEDEMVAGYLDGRIPDSPEPSGNRSRSYRHGFQSGRDDLSRVPSAPYAVRKQQAEEALAADAGVPLTGPPSSGGGELAETRLVGTPAPSSVKTAEPTR